MRFPIPLAAALALPTVAGAQTISAEPFGGFFAEQTCFASAPGDFERVWIGNKQGEIRVRRVSDGAGLGTFLDIEDRVNDAGEGGLLGLAFHPDYLNNGKFYASYTTGPTNDSVVAQFSVSAGNPNVADPGSEVFIWGPLPQSTNSHKGGALAFGPDGLLYYSVGDGGCCNNEPVFNSAQNLLNPRGKVLRFDVDLPFPHIPATNPFVGNPNALDEIYVYGLRNPWRIAFDSLNGDLYVGDVGETTKEEISWVPGGSGGGHNLGWRCMEGTRCTGLSGCTCNSPALTLPLHEYGPGGCVVVAGPVYRGSAIPALYGRALYADFCTDEVWSFVNSGGVAGDFADHTTDLDPSGALNIDSIVSFGTDAAGELYLVTFFSGRVYRIVGDCGVERYCDPAAPNQTGSPSTLAWSGSPSVSANDLVFTVAPLLPGNNGLIAYSPDQDLVPLGNGTLCLGTQTLGFVIRLPGHAVLGTSMTHALDVASPPLPVGQITVGSTWNFQAWNRDFTPGGHGFNFSDALRITFCP